MAIESIFERNMQLIRCKNNFGEFVEVPRENFFFRPSAYGFIINNGEIVTLTNKSNGKIWFPGGAIEIGERIEDGLRRETKEETGLDISIGKLILVKENFFYYQPLDEAYHAFLFFYYCKHQTTKLISYDDVNDLESKKPRWKKISEIREEDISDLSKDIYTAINNLDY